MERLICLALGYVFGLFQTAFIYGKINGIDIREHGSGNSGTTNALRVLGKKAGLIVLLGDFLKCALAIWVTKLIFGESHPDMVYLFSMYTAAGAILGHNFPFYMGFRGGKGIAATAGMVVALHLYYFPVCATLFFAVFFITHYVSLGSLLLYVALVVETIVLGQLGVFAPASQATLIEMYVIMFALAVMAFWRHRENIGRLVRGEERKTYLTKKNKLDVEKKAE